MPSNGKKSVIEDITKGKNKRTTVIGDVTKGKKKPMAKKPMKRNTGRGR